MRIEKGISILRIGWPDCTPSARTATASRAELLPDELDDRTGRITPEAISRICSQLERVRCESHAVRKLNLVSELRNGVSKIGGSIRGIGPRNGINITLPNQESFVVYPTVGVPSALDLYDASIGSVQERVAVIYDPIGLHPSWQNHLDWLAKNITSVKWVRVTEAAWDLATLGVN